MRDTWKEFKNVSDREGQKYNVLEVALSYLGKGLSVIPLKPRDKTPRIEWEKYQHQLPTEKEVREWFSKWPDSNIAIVCGRISGNLVVIDFDNREIHNEWVKSLPDELKQLYEWTWKVETGKGVHVYFRLADASQVPRTKPRLKPGLDIKAEGGYVVAPPSIHPSGKRYEFLNCNPAVDNIYILKRGEWELVKRSLGWEEPATPATTQPTAVGQLRELDAIGMQRLIELLLPAYRPGLRHYIWLYFSGWAAKAGVSPVSVARVLKALYDKTGDDDPIKGRGAALVYSYGKAGRDIDAYRQQLVEVLGEDPYGVGREFSEEEVKGKSGIQEILESAYGDEKALEVIKSIEEVLGTASPFSGDAIFACIDKLHSIFYVSHPRTRRLSRWVFTQDGGREERIVVRAALTEVTIYRPPAGEPRYEITWITEAGRQLRTLGTLKQVLDQLRSHALIATRQLAEDAVSSVLAVAEARGRAKVSEEVRAEGFYLKDGKPHTDLELGADDDPQELVPALYALNELAGRFSHAQSQFSATVKWSLLAPFMFCFKQAGRNPLPYLILQGPRDTGKTTLASVPRLIWGLPASKYTASVNMTPARLARYLSQWTFPVAVNEVEKLRDNDSVWPLIRDAWDSLVLRGKYVAGEWVEELSAAPLILTTRRPLYQQFSDDERKRFFLIDLTGCKPLPRERIEEFDKHYGKFAEKLARDLSRLRPFIYAWIKAHWDELLKRDLRFEWQNVGTELLSVLYRVAGLEPPEWVNMPHEPGPELGEEDYAERIISAIRKYVVETMARYASHQDFTDNSTIKMRLSWLASQGVETDIVLSPDESEIAIRSGFLKWLSREEGIELSSLQELATILNGEFKQVSWRSRGLNTRVAVIPISILE
ncbi:MAG: bifunctional DNA primase/polymerase [Infirmifilum sp.]